MKEDLSALVFDAYGTLFDVHSVVAECELLFPGQGRELSELWRSKQLQYSWLRSMMGTYENFWQITGDALEFACRSLGLAYSRERRDHLVNQYLTLEPFPEVPAALQALHKRYRLAILSNGAPDMLQQVATHAKVAGELDAIWSVDELKIYKPDLRVYEIATRKFALPREQIGFVSSNPFDVCGAGNFGFHTIWVHRHPAPFDLMGVQPDIEIRSLSDLLGNGGMGQ